MIWMTLAVNVWLGTTVENQGRADQRIPALLKVPAVVRFLSCEPLLEPIDLLHMERPPEFHMQPHGWPGWLGRKIHWVICGGESGPHARPMDARWARSLRDQCAAACVPFLFKQWGEWAPAVGQEYWSPVYGGPEFRTTSGSAGCHDFGNGYGAVRIGKHAAGRMLDGKLHDAVLVNRPSLNGVMRSTAVCQEGK